LIEVVIGMAILAMFLTAIFLSQARLTKQSVIARKKADAIMAVNELLATWAMDWQTLPTDDNGTFEGREQLQWATRLMDTPELEKLGFQKVELTVTDSTLAENTDPLLQMELAVMLPPPDSTPAPEAEAEADTTTDTQTTQHQTTEVAP
jgi:type II secretory pathway pseudopilin PulG